MLEKFHLRGGGGIKILGTQGWEKLGGEGFFSFKQGEGLTLDYTMFVLFFFSFISKNFRS